MASDRKLTLIRDQFASRQRAINNGKQRNFLTSIRSVSYNFSVSIIVCDVAAVVVTVANIEVSMLIGRVCFAKHRVRHTFSMKQLVYERKRKQVYQ